VNLILQTIRYKRCKEYGAAFLKRILLNKDTFLMGTFNKVPTLHDFTPSNEDTLLIRTLFRGLRVSVTDVQKVVANTTLFKNLHVKQQQSPNTLQVLDTYCITLMH